MIEALVMGSAEGGDDDLLTRKEASAYLAQFGVSSCPRSGDGEQRFSQFVAALDFTLDERMLANPYRGGCAQHRATLVGQRDAPAATIVRIYGHRDEAGFFQRLEVRSHGGAIHRQKLGYSADRRRFRAVQAVHQRELPAGDAVGTKGVVEPA